MAEDLRAFMWKAPRPEPEDEEKLLSVRPTMPDAEDEETLEDGTV